MDKNERTKTDGQLLFELHNPTDRKWDAQPADVKAWWERAALGPDTWDYLSDV